MKNNHNIKLLSVIFFTGAVVLSLELLASRILTPFFGVSLYIWTSILSVTLIFLAIGYQFGGWITSKIRSDYYEELFLLIPFVSSIFIIISTISYPILFPKLINLNLLVGSFIGSSLLLSIPLILMSSLNPILISIIKDKDIQSSDSKSGFVFFISTIGSVFGVIFTALVLIPNLTNFSSFIVNAIFLVVYNMIIYFLIGYASFKKIKKLFLFLNIILFIFLLSALYFKESYLNHFTSSKDKYNNNYIILSEHPSFYGNLKVVGFKAYNQDYISQYMLRTNNMTQGVVDKNGNSLHAFSYALDALSQLSQSQKGDALILGLGVGSVPKTLVDRGFNVDVVEIEPKTLKFAKKFFSYKPINTNFFFEDARTYVRKCKKNYDLIIIDLYFSDGVPEHLTTKEFYNDLNNCLSDKGILLSNSSNDFQNKETLKLVLSTFGSVFNNLYYFDQPGKKMANLYIIASNNDKLERIYNFNPEFNYLPKKIKPELIRVFSNLKKFDNKNLKNEYINYDEKNRYSEFFAKSLMSYRKFQSLNNPSRLLIN